MLPRLESALGSCLSSHGAQSQEKSQGQILLLMPAL